MKKLITLIFVFFCLVACKQQPQAHGVIFTKLNGQQIHLDSNNHKWVVLNYWASWCKPCYKEIPSLNAFAKKHQDRLWVLGVSYDHVALNVIPSLVKKMGIEFATLKYDPSLALGIKQVPGLPVTYVINPQGKVVKRLLGVQTEESLRQAVN